MDHPSCSSSFPTLRIWSPAANGQSRSCPRQPCSSALYAHGVPIHYELHHFSPERIRRSILSPPWPMISARRASSSPDHCSRSRADSHRGVQLTCWVNLAAQIGDLSRLQHTVMIQLHMLRQFRLPPALRKLTRRFPVFQYRHYIENSPSSLIFPGCCSFTLQYI